MAEKRFTVQQHNGQDKCVRLNVITKRKSCKYGLLSLRKNMGAISEFVKELHDVFVSGISSSVRRLVRSNRQPRLSSAVLC